MGEAFASALGIELYDGATRVASIEVDTNNSGLSYLFSGDRKVDVTEAQVAEDAKGLMARDFEIELKATGTVYRVVLADGTVEERIYPAIGTGMDRLRLFSGFGSAINKQGRIDQVRIETASGDLLHEWDFADESQLQGWTLPEPIYVMETATAAGGTFASHLRLLDNDPADTVLGAYRFGGKFASGEISLALALQGESGSLRLHDGNAEVGRLVLTRTGEQVRLEMNGYYQSAEAVSLAASMDEPLWVILRWGNEKLRIRAENAGGDTLYDRTMMFRNNDAVPDRVAFEAGGLIGAPMGTELYVAGLSLQLGQEVEPLQHPHILLSAEEFGQWQAKMDNSPWQQMGQAAISAAPNTRYDQSNDPNQANKADSLVRVFSLNSLAYILDQGDRSRYVTNVRRAFEVGMVDLISNHSSGSGWVYEVPVNSAIMYGILALDIMGDAYTSDQVADYEQLLRDKIDQQVNIAEIRGTEAVAALMAFYEGDWPRFQNHYDLHTAKLRRDIGSDGVYLGGSTYGWARMTSRTRAAKHMLDDILTVNGSMDTYRDPLLQLAHTWLTGYALTPFGHFVTYGDSQNSRAGTDVLAYRSALFGEEPASYLAYHVVNNLEAEMIPSTDLLNFATAKSDLRDVEPKSAPSRIFENQAAFRGQSSGRYAMYGYLFSPVAASGHAKFEVNSLELGAFGEKLLLNSGYPAWGSDWGGFSWDWFHFDSESNNVVEFNDVRHSSVVGGGISGGLLADWVGFASGRSGDAITEGNHSRTLVQFEQENDFPGYWVVIDEVLANGLDSSAQLILHPNTGAVATLYEDFQYFGEVSRLQSDPIAVGPLPFNQSGIGLQITLGVQPHSVQIREGAHSSGATSQYSYLTEYIVAEYPLQDASPRRLLTHFSPSSEESPAPVIERRIFDNSSLILVGDEFNHDWLLLNQPGHAYDSERQSLDSDAAFAMARVGSKGIRHLMINGSFLYNWASANPQRTFAVSSSVPVSMIQNNRSIQLLASEPVVVDFYYPMITGITVNGQIVDPIETGADWIRCALPVGSHQLEIQASGIYGSFDILKDEGDDWYLTPGLAWLWSDQSLWPMVFHQSHGWLFMAGANGQSGEFIWHFNSSSWLYKVAASNWAFDYSEARWFQL